MAKNFQSKDTSSSSRSKKSAAAHVQAKVKVGQKNDRFENEADQTANKVVAQSATKDNAGSIKPVADRISKLDAGFGKQAGNKKADPDQKQDDQVAQKKSKEKEPVQKKEEKGSEKKESVQKKEDEAAQNTKEEKAPIQKKADKESVNKEPVQKKEDEAAQSKTEEKPPVQKKSKKETENKDSVQKKDEETAQTKIQREPQEAQDANISEMVKQEPVQSKEEESDVQTKAEIRPNVRDKKTYPVLNSLEPMLLASKGKGDPMSAELRTEMEAKFGADFRKVRIHTGMYSMLMASKMNAQAFTNGSDIYFNSGKYEPDSVFGKFLLAHELTHVIQQGEAEQQLSESKIAESNASRNDPIPNPVDKDAEKVKELVEKDKKEQSDKEMATKGKEKPQKKLKPKAKSKTKGKGKGKKEDKDKMPQSIVGIFLKKISESAVKKKKAKLNKLAKNQMKKDDAKTKLDQSQKSVVPPSLESQSKANATQVETVDMVKEPKPQEQEVKKEFNKAMEKAVPSSLEAMDKFKEEGKGRVVGEKVRGVVTADTQEVKQTYQEIENAPEPAQAPTPVDMPATEIAPKTGPLNMGNGVIGEVQAEHTDMSEYQNKTDDVLKEEEISDEQLEMVDSGPLAEANTGRKKLNEQVETGPKEVKQLEMDKKKEVGKEMKKEEIRGKKKMEAKRNKELTNTKTKQKDTKKTIEQKRQTVTDHINGLYKTANDQVKKKLEDLENQSLKAFDVGQAAATKDFENNVKRRLNAYKSDRYSGMFGWARWLKDKLRGMDKLPAVKRIFDSEKANFISSIDSLIAKITVDNKKVIQECKDLVKTTRTKIAEFVSKLGPELQDVGQKAQADMQTKLDALDETVNKKEEELKKKLDEKREAAIKAIDEKIESMKEELSGLAGKLAALLLGALIKFFTWAIEKIGGSSEKIMKIVNKSKKVIKKIVKSPGTFIGNLGKAIKQGFDRFDKNFTKHLLNGIVEWLVGAMGNTGITIPKKFDMKGVMSMGLQIMGLTWDRIREKIVKKVGEPAVAAAEKGIDIIQKVREKGFIVLWDMLVAKAQELKAKVLESISAWAVVQMVKAAVTKLLMMLNPAGAILQIALTIYDGVMWFIDNMQRIMDFIMSIFNSISEIAFGQLGKAASFIEKALAKIIPIILSFLARWLKLSGIGKAIQTAVKKVRAPIDKVMDKIINFIVKKVRKFIKKGKGAAKKVKGAVLNWWKKKKSFKAKDGKPHKLFFKGSKERSVLTVASKETPLTKFIKDAKKINTDAKLDADYTKASSLSKSIDKIKGQLKAEKKGVKSSDIDAKMALLVPLISKFLGGNEKSVKVLEKHLNKKVLKADQTIMVKFRNDVDSNLNKVDGEKVYTIVESSEDKGTTIRRAKNKKTEGFMSVNIDEKGILVPGVEKKFVPNHKNYIPDKIMVSEKNGVYTATYTTKTFNGDPGPTFTIDISFDEVLDNNKDNIEQRIVNAKGLVFKPEGNPRGVTDSASGGFDNAHIIGDRFGGSGKNKAANIYPSSPNYNRKTMLAKEDAMAKIFSTKMKFDLTVTAKIKEEQKGGNSLKDLLKKEFTKDNSKNAKGAENIQKELSAKLQTSINQDIKKLPGQFISVVYKSNGNYSDLIGVDADYQKSVDEFEKKNVNS